MNLAIDIGNTLAKLAIIDGGQVVDFLKTEQIDTAYIEKLLKANPGIDAAVIVSSRDTDEELERFLEQRMKRFSARKRVSAPGEMLPPRYSPRSVTKSIVMAVPKSTIRIFRPG